MPLDTTSSITNLINQCGVNLYYLLRCYHPLLIPSAFRAQIRDIFLRNKRPDTVYSISTVSTIRYGGLGINDNIVVCLQSRQFPLQPLSFPVSPF